jgi:hypothetical protein
VKVSRTRPPVWKEFRYSNRVPTEVAQAVATTLSLTPRIFTAEIEE